MRKQQKKKNTQAEEQHIIEDSGMGTTDITMKDLFLAVETLNSGKAPGPDGITVDDYQ